MYQFGQFVIRFILENGVEFQPPLFWQRYHCVFPVNPVMTLFLSAAELPEGKNHINGWCHNRTAELSVVTFYERGSPKFSLSYREHCRDVWICAHKALDRNLMLGIQYGMLFAIAPMCVGLHGVTVICGNQAIILSAPSGTGKTTLAKLLHKYCEAAIVNGDFAMLSVDEQHRVVFEPTPFCGTSKRCFNQRLYIDRIVFLEQAPENRWEELPSRCKVESVLSNLFIPEWDAEASSMVHSHAMSIMEAVPISRFAFEPTEEAAKMFYACVNK